MVFLCKIDNSRMVGQSGYVRAHPYRNKPFPFDLVLAPDAFPLTKEMEDGDAKLTEVGTIVFFARNLPRYTSNLHISYVTMIL